MIQLRAQEQRDEAIVWMNRGQATSQCDPMVAQKCYTRAINLLSPLDREGHPDWSNSLGAALMNRGRLRHQLSGIADAEEVEGDFETARRVLGEARDSGMAWIRRNLAGVEVNRANLLLDLRKPWSARHFALNAVVAIEPLSSIEAAEPVDCQLYLLAKRCVCDSLGQILPTVGNPTATLKLAHEAGDHADEALALIRRLRDGPEEPFAELSVRFFRFGSGLYAPHQPQFLIEFLDDHFEGICDWEVRHVMLGIALDSTASAMKHLSDRMFELTRDLDIMDRARTMMASLLEAHERYDAERRLR